MPSIVQGRLYPKDPQNKVKLFWGAECKIPGRAVLEFSRFLSAGPY